MRMSWTGMAALTLVGVMAATSFAQQGGERGRGGFGGFGGGGGAVMLAGNPAVQKELAVTEDQAAKLKTVIDAAREEMRPAGGGENLRDLPEEERRAKFAEMAAKRAETARKVEEKFKPKLAEVLDAKQVERLNQIALQQAGPQAYANPDVVKALKLSKEQQEKLAAITKDYGEKIRESMGGPGGGGGDFQARFAKMRELNTARDKELEGVLSSEQKEQFAALKGKAFEMPRGGFGGRPGGEGRPGGRGRPEGDRPRPPE